MNSIGLAFNIYCDNRAVHGLLECAAPYFDDIVAIHAGPNGRRSNDGTIETLERWGVRTVFMAIDAGFGVVRTRCIRESQATFVAIMDADERLYPYAPVLRCEGEEAYPQTEDPKLTVTYEGLYDQGSILKELIQQPHIRAVKTVRRHWFRPGFIKPCQNWGRLPDFQLRIVKNDPLISYDPKVPMHERIIDQRTGGEPKCAQFSPGDPRGIFFDHYHCFWKKQEPEQRQEDIKIYDALHYGTTEKVWKELGYA